MRKQIMGVAYPKEAAGRVVIRDRNNQLLGRPRLPDEVPLKLGQSRLATMNLPQELFELPRIGVFEKRHRVSAYRKEVVV